MWRYPLVSLRVTVSHYQGTWGRVKQLVHRGLSDSRGLLQSSHRLHQRLMQHLQLWLGTRPVQDKNTGWRLDSDGDAQHFSATCRDLHVFFVVVLPKLVQIDCQRLPPSHSLWWCFDKIHKSHPCKKNYLDKPSNTPSIVQPHDHMITSSFVDQPTWLKILCRPDWLLFKNALPWLNLISRFGICGYKKNVLQCPTINHKKETIYTTLIVARIGVQPWCTLKRTCRIEL